MASGLLSVVIVSVLQMFIGGSVGIQSSKVRSMAQSEVVAGIEGLRVQDISSIQTTPIDQYVTKTVRRDDLIFSRVTHYQITDSNHDGLTDSRDYIIATVSVTWDAPTPVRPSRLTIYKTY